jgi:hydroxymethylbilane synthase
MDDTTRTLRLGTRGSLLARTQSGLVAAELERRHPGLKVEQVQYTSSGDRIAERPLHEFGGKGLFTREIEQALLACEVDFAVHSFKDMPITMPLIDASELMVAAVPPREDVRDVLICRSARTIAELPAEARIGTGSLRRRCQFLVVRPDLRIEPIRGNIDTRLRKLREGAFDAVILAAAGLRRAGLFDPEIMSPIDPRELLPAPGQGALALQCRTADEPTRTLLQQIGDADALACVSAERELVRLLRGDCLSPIAAMATIDRGQITMLAAVGARGGEPPVLRARAVGEEPGSVANEVFHLLAQQHVEALLYG